MKAIILILLSISPTDSKDVEERQQRNDEMFDDILDVFNQFYRENNIVISGDETKEQNIEEVIE